jgi:hypothetical protein
MEWLDFIRPQLLALPILTKFAIMMAVIVGVPALSRQLRLPAAVGLLFAGPRHRTARNRREWRQTADRRFPR